MRDSREYCDGKLMECGKILEYEERVRSIVTLNLHLEIIFRSRSYPAEAGSSICFNHDE